jgi:hypothetical protein
MEAKQHENAADSIVLEEEIDPNYVPSENEVVEYAKWLGMDLEKDHDLYWIAREGLKAPLPENWKPCKTKDTDDIYYFNFSTGESTWDHPCDGFYKRLYEEEKKKKEITMKVKEYFFCIHAIIQDNVVLMIILNRRKMIQKELKQSKMQFNYLVKLIKN